MSKKLINKPETVVSDMLYGLAEANPDLVYIDGAEVISRREKSGQVGVLSGGGAGHEPAHAGYVGAANELGIVMGADGNFYPDSVITREDACVIVYRAARLVGLMISDGTSDFIDREEFSSYATDAIGALNGSGIINGIGEGRFAPKENLSRAAAAKIVCMISERSERT